MPRWLLADLKTGRQILDLPVLSGRWERLLNAPETIDVTLDMRDPDTIALYPRNSAAPARTILAVAEGDVILAAGVVWTQNYDRDNATLQLSGKGVWSYYDHRYVLPLAAATVDVTTFTIPDVSAAGKTKPNPALGTYLNGFELGTIAKKWVQQAHAWTNGALPIVFESDRVAATDDNHQRNIEGSEFKNVGQVLEQLTAVRGGPDIIFQPRFTSDRLGVEWVLRTGTEAVPQIYGSAIHRWNVTTRDSAVSNFSAKLDASDIGSLAWVTGGRSGDMVLVGRSTDTTLTDIGYPLYEILDSSHSDVSVQATLNNYAAEETTVGRGPVEEWSFSVETSQQPYVGSYWEGDFCDVDVAGYNAADGTGDPYLFEGGTFRRRITGLRGDDKGLVVDVTTAPVRNN